MLIFFMTMLIVILFFRHATCLEGALKIKEISYMHSEGEFLHNIFVTVVVLTRVANAIRYPRWRAQARPPCAGG